MRLHRRIEPWFAIVLVLMAIGLADRLMNGWQAFIIPVTLVAIIYILYKFPPNRWGRGRSGSAHRGSPYNPGAHARRSQPKPTSRSGPAKTQQRRPSPFRVIEGRKNNDDEPPRYH